MLDVELQTFAENLTELMKEHQGRFVVIQGREIVSFHDTMQDALAEGARRFGGSSFLARRIEETPQEVSIPALTLGLLRANPSRTVFSSGHKA